VPSHLFSKLTVASLSGIWTVCHVSQAAAAADTQAAAEAKAYFRAYHEQRAASQAEHSLGDVEADGADGTGDASTAPDTAPQAKVALSTAEWVVLEDRQARIYAASELASATCNAAAPLLVNDSLEVATAATDVIVVRP
jgi:thiamine monophosphate synthase